MLVFFIKVTCSICVCVLSTKCVFFSRAMCRDTSERENGGGICPPCRPYRLISLQYYRTAYTTKCKKQKGNLCSCCTSHVNRSLGRSATTANSLLVIHWQRQTSKLTRIILGKNITWKIVWQLTMSREHSGTLFPLL